MAYLDRTQIGIKDISNSVTVPDNPKAKLMYYLECMTTVLQLDGIDADLRRLTNYRRHSDLSHRDTLTLIHLCQVLSPYVLQDKCIFQSDVLCGNMANKFYSIESVRNNLLVAGNIMIGGRSQRVSKIMTYTNAWLRKNYWNPMWELEKRSSACTII